MNFYKELRRHDGKKITLEIFVIDGRLEVSIEGGEILLLENKPSKNSDLSKKILNYFNLKCHKAFKPLKANLTPINGRLREGFTEKDCYAVIDLKCSQWLGDEKMELYLRPATIFGNKMDSYLNESKSVPKTKKDKIDDIFSKRTKEEHEF